MFTLLADGPDAAPPAYRRAAAFSISRLLVEGSKDRKESLDVILSQIHQPFLRVVKPSHPDDLAGPEQPRATDCIATLQTILVNTDPSPVLLSTVFTPIAPALYAILMCLDSKKTADPALRETVKGLLGTWSRIVSAQEVEQVCWSIIEGEGGYWKIDIAGEIIQTAEYFFPCILARRKADRGVLTGPQLPKVSRSSRQNRWKKLRRVENLTSIPIRLVSGPTLFTLSDFSRR